MAIHKENKGKPEVAYVYRSFIEAIAQVRMYGAKKYENYESWTDVPSEDFYNAAQRHLLAAIDATMNPMNKGNPLFEVDESGLLHLAHAACDIMYLIERRHRDEIELLHQVTSFAERE